MLRLAPAPWVMLALVLATISAPVVHEMGHAVAARLTGGRVIRVDLGPIGLRVGPLWRVMRNKGIRSWGVHILWPSVEGIRWRNVVTVAAGPAAAAVLGVGYYAVGAGVGGAARAVLWIAAALTLAETVVNLMPYSGRLLGRAHTFDGWRIVNWYRRPVAMCLRVATSTLHLYAGQGVRPADWPSSWVAVAAKAPADADVARWASARYLAYLAARDRGRLDEAWSYLCQPLRRAAELSAVQRAGLVAEAAIHGAWALRDPVSAEALFKQVPKLPILASSRLRALAAIAFAAGNPTAAVQICDRILAMPDSADQPGMTIALKDWTRALRAEALTHLSASATNPEPATMAPQGQGRPTTH
jgi:hypothetical protein